MNQSPVRHGGCRARLRQFRDCCNNRFHRLIGAKPLHSPPHQMNQEPQRRSFFGEAFVGLRAFVLRLEYWISPNGVLRAILRISLKVAIILAVPLLIAGPSVLLLLDGVSAAVGLLASIAGKLVMLVKSFVIVLVGIFLIAMVGRGLGAKR